MQLWHLAIPTNPLHFDKEIMALMQKINTQNAKVSQFNDKRSVALGKKHEMALKEVAKFEGRLSSLTASIYEIGC